MSPTKEHLTPAVAIVGAGPAGLTAAAELARTTAGDVVVLDRERYTGGIPRHSDHTGYGLRDLHRVMTGPQYAKRLSAQALASGATLRTESMVTSCRIGQDGTSLELDVTSPAGLTTVCPTAVILATGARERPRTARRIPGDRPGGVLTTGMLQNLVHLHHQDVGTRAVVVGSELVSWSAVVTLREAGCRTVTMVTSAEHPEAYLAFSAFGRVGLGVGVTTRSRVVKVIGRRRVSAVELEDLDTGARHLVNCDTVVFTGDWIPDHELARSAGLELDPATLGPAVDTLLRTSVDGVFAAGNLVHPVDTADVAALDGLHVAKQVRGYLNRRPGYGPADTPRIRLVAGDPFAWVAPNVLTPGAPPPSRGKLLLWPRELSNLPVVEATQDGRRLDRRRVPWPAAPGRVFRVPFDLVSGFDPTGGEVRVGLVNH